MQIAFAIYALLLVVGGVMGASKSSISLIAGIGGGLLSATAAFLYIKNPKLSLRIGVFSAVLMLGGMIPRYLQSHAVWPAGIVCLASIIVLVACILSLVQSRKAAA